MWDGRTRRYVLFEKKIVFEKNKKNGMVSIFQVERSMLESLKKDIDRRNKQNNVYEKDELWTPEVKILDEVSNRSKLFEIIGINGEMISFGHSIFELGFSVKLPQ